MIMCPHTSIIQQFLRSLIFTKMPSIKPTKLFKLQVCPDCSSQLQTHAFTKYCPACQKCPTLFDTSMLPNQTLSVPNWNISYGHGNQDVRVPSSLVKIQTYLGDLLCKLNIRLTLSQMESIKEKVRYMHNKRGPKCKGYRQQTAVLLFCVFQHQFRMTLHQFCQKTGLNRKKFNKMYLIYKNYIKQTQSKEQNDNVELDSDINQDMKLQTKREEEQKSDNQSKQQQGNNKLGISLKKQQQEQQQKQYSMLSHKKVQFSMPCIQLNKKPSQNSTSYDTQQQLSSIHSTLQSLFPHIFPSSFLQTHKSQIQSSLCSKTAQLCQYYYQTQPSSFLGSKKYFRIPAALYCIIKLNNYKITLKKYIQLVDKVLNIKLTDRIISKLMAMYKKYLQGNSNGTTTIADDHDQGSSPTQLDHQNNRSQCPSSSVHQNQSINLQQIQKQGKFKGK